LISELPENQTAVDRFPYQRKLKNPQYHFGKTSSETYCPKKYLREGIEESSTVPWNNGESLRYLKIVADLKGFPCPLQGHGGKKMTNAEGGNDKKNMSDEERNEMNFGLF